MIPDRIPPRVDTPIAVAVGGAVSAANPVILSIEGAGAANGTATIAGSATAFPLDVAGNHIINLQGIVQTTENNAGNLRLVATHAGATLAARNGFSISAIPQNLNFTGSSPFKNNDKEDDKEFVKLGFVVTYDWESDSNNLRDLDRTLQCEVVEIAFASGVLGDVVLLTNPCNPSSQSISDTHELKVAELKDSKVIWKRDGLGTFITKQTFVFQDRRSGATDVPMTHSGFVMTRIIFGNEIISTKAGAATTAHGVSSEAGGGTTFVLQFF
jgi:hypothetical protein